MDLIEMIFREEADKAADPGAASLADKAKGGTAEEESDIALDAENDTDEEDTQEEPEVKEAQEIKDWYIAYKLHEAEEMAEGEDVEDESTDEDEDLSDELTQRDETSAAPAPPAPSPNDPTSVQESLMFDIMDLLNEDEEIAAGTPTDFDEEDDDDDEDDEDESGLGEEDETGEDDAGAVAESVALSDWLDLLEDEEVLAAGTPSEEVDLDDLGDDEEMTKADSTTTAVTAPTTEPELENKPVEEAYSYSDREIYAELDESLEEAFVEHLKNRISKDKVHTLQEKMEAIDELDNGMIRREHVESFMESYIKPTLKLSGIYSGKSNSPISVSLPIYEIANIIEDAVTGELFESYTTETSEVVSESYNDSILPADLFRSTSLEELNEDGSEIDLSEKMDLVESLICRSLKEFGISEDKWNDFVEEAVELVDNVPMTDIIANIAETYIFVDAYNEKSKKLGKPSLNEMSLNDVLFEAEGDAVAEPGKVRKALSKVKGWVSDKSNRAWEGAKSGAKTVGGKSSSAAKWIADKSWGDRSFKNREHWHQNIGKRSATIGSVLMVVGTMATMAWRAKRDSKCYGLSGAQKYACLMVAADDAIKALKSQMSACDNTKNPEKCKASIERLIDKWARRKAKYAKK